ncbi:MAG: hypothetical protein LBI96_02530 [Odoribacteraceae bacterium]|nr:hypothetical protein [Odoribacteraceae bacterium]
MRIFKRTATRDATPSTRAGEQRGYRWRVALVITAASVIVCSFLLLSRGLLELFTL